MAPWYVTTLPLSACFKTDISIDRTRESATNNNNGGLHVLALVKASITNYRLCSVTGCYGVSVMTVSCWTHPVKMANTTIRVQSRSLFAWVQRKHPPPTKGWRVALFIIENLPEEGNTRFIGT